MQAKIKEYVKNPSRIQIRRTGKKTLAFSGVLLGEGENLQETGHIKTVHIYVTEHGYLVAEKYVASNWPNVQSSTDAKIFFDPETMLEWLGTDNEGELTFPPEAEDAITSAAEKLPLIETAFTEEI